MIATDLQQGDNEAGSAEAPGDVETSASGDANMPKMDHPQMGWTSIQGFGNPLAVARVLVNNFTYLGAKRGPPASFKTEHYELCSIPQSPFNEKVRWVLDMLEADQTSPIYYTEDSHPPALHAFRVVPITDAASSRTPVLIAPDGNHQSQSSSIIRKLYPSLYPEEIAEEIKAFEIEVGNRIGSTMRSIIYYYLLCNEKKYYKTMVELSSNGTSAIEGLLFDKMLDKGIDKALIETLTVSEEATEKSIKEINDMLSEISERLERNGGEYIFDSPDKKYGFTAADLAFAAVANPMIRAPQMIDFVGQEEQYPTAFVHLCHQWQQTKAGQHCLAMYNKHRPVQEDGKVHVKTVNRDTNPVREVWVYMVGKR